MRGGLRKLLERVEVATLIFLVVTAPIVDILENLGVFRTSLGETLLTLLIANVAALVITVDTRVFEVAQEIHLVRQTVRQEVAVRREQVYEEVIHVLSDLTVENANLPVRIYVPQGVLVTDEA